MQHELLETLRCPVTKTQLRLEIILEKSRSYEGGEIMVVEEGILFSEHLWFYPIINGIPRLCIESFLDNRDFFKQHMPDFNTREKAIRDNFRGLLNFVIKKNKRTKKSFSNEWKLFNYETDKTWDADAGEMTERFLQETGEQLPTLQKMFVFDAGCGNGKLNGLLGAAGVRNLGMDFSNSVEAADRNNTSANTHFIQGDVQFPPVASAHFDLVHSSGVLIATNNTELSFSCLTPTVKPGGKISIWLYSPRKNFVHNLFNFIRHYTSKMPLWLQRVIYLATIFPVSYCIKKLKGNPQNPREMMVDILDWFSPEFRWEHTKDEATSWFPKRGFSDVSITTTNAFGYNITGVKKA